MQYMAPGGTVSVANSLTFVVPVSSMVVTRMKPAPKAGSVRLRAMPVSRMSLIHRLPSAVSITMASRAAT